MALNSALAFDSWTTAEDRALMARFDEVCYRRQRRVTSATTMREQSPVPEEIRAWMMTTTAQRFGALNGAWGIDPWQPLSFIAWLNDAQRIEDPAIVAAGRFVLFVFEPRTHWGLAGCSPWQPFNISQALAAWGPEDRAAFVAWLDEPVWP